MVSSKCCHVESPSPFRFLAALMPPWAQTECDRFTGTIENRSTCPPISAILMAADKPASPPPTTMILGLAAIGECFQSAPLRAQRMTIEFADDGFRGCSGVERKAYMLAAPTSTNPTATARHTQPKRRWARSPLMIPHLAVNNHNP